MNQPLSEAKKQQASADRVSPDQAADVLLRLLDSKVPVSLALDLSQNVTDSQSILLEEADEDTTQTSRGRS